MNKSEQLREESKMQEAFRIKDLKETIASTNEEAMLVDGHDDSLVGYDTQGRAVYLVKNIIETLMERDGMSQDEAIEFFDFNIAGAFVGEYTPIYMYEE